MLPAAHRLRSSADFRTTTRHGRRGASGPIVIHLLAGQSGPARAGLIVPKSVGNSVVRHRVSRRLRAGLADALPGLTPGTLVVVRALPGAASDPQLGQRTRAALERLAAPAETA